MDTTAAAIVKEFFNDFPVVRIPKSEILLRPGDKLTHVFYLIKGNVIEYDISSSGNEVIVNTFKPGAYFPMSLAVNTVHNNYFFETSSTIEVRKAPVENVVDFVRTHPEVCFDLLRRVYSGTDGLIRRMAHLMGGKARSRLIFELLNGAARFGEMRDGNAVYLPMTEKDIAKRSGLSRETVSRTMGSLKDEGLVAVRAGGIYIPDVKIMTDVIGNQL